MIKAAVKIAMVLAAMMLVMNLWWLDRYFGPTTADQIVFHLQVPLAATENSFFGSYVLAVFVGPGLAALLYGALFSPKIAAQLKRNPLLGRLVKLTALWFPALALALALVISAFIMEAPKTLAYSLKINPTDFYEKNYVPLPDNGLIFSEKRNLVIIFMESLEAAYSDQSLFGEDLLPRLNALSQNHLSFSGFRSTQGSRWTAAALASDMCSLPVNIFRSAQGKHFLPKAKCLPDILNDNGYQLVYMQGSSASFAGTDLFLKDYGPFEIHDLDYFLKNDGSKVLEGSLGAPDWGLKDASLYEQAQKTLSQLSQTDKPFALVMMTIDTHGYDGYLDQNCPAPKGDFRDVVTCADRQAADFITWIQPQPFGGETVIMVMGDHQVMANGLSKQYLDKLPQRRLYNLIIDPAVPAPNLNRNRHISHLDFMPTALEAAGAVIPGGRLALGASLYQPNVPTLAEKYGFEKLNEELARPAAFYDRLAGEEDIK